MKTFRNILKGAFTVLAISTVAVAAKDKVRLLHLPNSTNNDCNTDKDVKGQKLDREKAKVKIRGLLDKKAKWHI